jgi:hypothetical protein
LWSYSKWNPNAKTAIEASVFGSVGPAPPDPQWGPLRDFVARVGLSGYNLTPLPLLATAADGKMSAKQLGVVTLHRPVGPEELRLRDQVDLDVNVAVAMGRPGAPFPTTQEERTQRIGLAIRHQCCAVLDALLVAERAAELEGRVSEPRAVEALLWTSRRLAGAPPLDGAMTAAEFLSDTAADWMRESDTWRAGRPGPLVE